MALHNLFVYPRYPENLSRLLELAYNLWTLWDPDAIRLFDRLDRNLFRSLRRNPIELLHALSPEKLDELSRDKGFLEELDRVWTRYKRAMSPEIEPRIAYFSMEFGLYLLPIYAGGLGMLAGDHLKGASDLGLPITGVGLYYRYGYFRQRVNVEGAQEEIYREAQMHYLPIREWKGPGGESLYVNISVRDRPLRLKIWQVLVGRVKLLLLDANLPENPPELRTITDHLYVSDREKRLLQEIVVGVGGLRALEVVGMKPQVYHLNEGHSAFLIIERLRKMVVDEGRSYEEAVAIIKSTTVFTTHTPVEAGNESFDIELIRRYFTADVESIGMTFDQFAENGFLRDRSSFWMPALAIRFSNYVNGVSVLHAGVSRTMWQDLFPGVVEPEIPIVPITNGVHSSWVATEVRELLRSYLGSDLITSNNNEQELRRRLDEVPDHELWDVHMRGKRRMINYLRRLVSANWLARGYSPSRIQKAREMLNVGFLTVGFARRFAGYKRPNLILRDKERLARLLKDPSRPVQILFAGKAHPADGMGKGMIKEIVDFAAEYEVEDRVFFVENYDREVAEHLVQGVDLWLNNPIKPNEASGTSGMKAGMNGVLNLSVLDGWWPESFNGKNGWAITAGDFYENPEMRDAAEANQIYEYLEGEIADLYYDRDESGIPLEWVERMKESIWTVSRGFSIERMLGDYQELFYEPALAAHRALTEDDGAHVRQIVHTISRLEQHWPQIQIKEVRTDLDQRRTVFSGDRVKVVCHAYLDGVDPEDLAVEVFYFRSKQDEFQVIPLRFAEKQSDRTARYEGEVAIVSSGVQNIDVRLVPASQEARRLRPELIKWASEGA